MPLSGDEFTRNKPYFVWDIETVKWVNFLVVGVYADQFGFTYFKTFREFLAYVFEKYSDYDGFAHFGGRFDHLFLIKAILELIEDGEPYKIESMIPRGASIFSIEISYKDKSVRFFDSSALFPFALKRITENFGVTHKKQEIDYDKITKITPKLIDYLMHDCMGLYQSLTKFFSWPLIQKSGRAFSLASQSLRVLRTFIDKPVFGLSRDLDAQIRKGYFGGRTEIFRCIHEGPKPLFCYDVNSLYPYVMRENEYPNGLKFETYAFDKKALGFWYCTVSVPKDMHVPPIGIVHRKKYIFPVGTFKAFITTAEVNYCREIGCKIKVERGYVFKNAGKIFKGFVDELYRIRENSKRDSVDNTIAKLLLNSCYGRFGLNSKKEQIVFDDGRTGLALPGGEEIIIRVRNKNFRLMVNEVELASFSNVAIAAYVTAYARIHMHRLLSKCGSDIYYTDTDSLFTTKELPTGTGLGELKLEYECQSACFLLPKTYRAGDKIVMKGFEKKKIQKFTHADFVECLRGDLKRLKINQEPKFATFKTAIRKGELVTMTKASTREIRSLYDKRLVQKSKKYKTKPIEVHI